MSKPIVNLVDDLPTNNLTTKMLHALDFVAPGEWQNLVGFDNTIKVLTGETDEKMVKKIGERAIRLFNDSSQGYQRALWLYQTVDSAQGMLGFTALVNKVGERFSMLSVLNKITPRSEKLQTIDLSVKLVVELVAFCYINGIPGDSIKDFVKALTSYAGESMIRMAALVCVDGLLPLGPDALSKILSLLQSSGVADLEKNERFQKVQSMVPGADAAGKLAFVRESMGAVGDWMKDFVAKRQVTVDKVAGSMKSFVDYAENKLDYLAAFLDMTTNYYEHTGVQTLARSLILRAVSEI